MSAPDAGAFESAARDGVVIAVDTSDAAEAAAETLADHDASLIRTLTISKGAP
jgi:hypothetical protein